MPNEILANSRILIVDDNYETLSLLGNLLTMESFSVIPANNGDQAIAIALEKKPDLILLDILMEGKDGYEVCREMKMHAELINIPVIFLTGQTDPDDIIKGLNYGAVDFISKPFNHSELLARIRTHLRVVKYREKMMESATLLHMKEMELMQKDKEKAEALLEYKEKELVGLTLRLTKAGKLMDQLANELQKVVSDFDNTNVDKINEVINSFKMQIDLDNWKQIEAMFLNIHSGFFNKILAQNPDLSSNELKLCALMRLNMTTKDIAAFTLQSEGAIKKARYRLRQKLNLPTDENLLKMVFQF
jgi:DNA-binding response OmpR family regulator/DNA-binding CsgD family transcriptional regulator